MPCTKRPGRTGGENSSHVRACDTLTLSKRYALMSLKVCLYISAFSPGGAERQIVNLAAELAGRGIRVALLYARKELQDACYLDAIRGKGVDLINVVRPDFLKQGILLSKQHADFYDNIPAPPSLRLASLYLAGAFSCLKPDVVHSYLDLTNCTAGCAAVLAEVPAHLASFCSLDPVTLKSNEAELAYPLYQYLLAHARPHFEACSRAGAAHYARWLDIPLETITYSPNGLDPTVYLAAAPDAGAAVRKALGIPATAPVLLSLSRFIWAKAPESLLDIFRRVLAARPDCHLLVAGTGMADDEEMGELLRKCGPADHVHLLGVRGDVASLFASADIFLLPSRVESFPISIMEAMAMGVPVVASTVGGIPDLVRHGEDGFLHDPQDVAGMAESVLTLLADAAIRERFGEAGRQRIAREFSLQKLGDRALARYEELLAECDRGCS